MIYGVVLNRKDRIVGHLKLGLNTRLGCEYRIWTERVKMGIMNSVEIDNGGKGKLKTEWNGQWKVNQR